MKGNKEGLKFAIRLEKDYYQAGDTVYGRIYINSRIDFQCSAILLEIEGIQSCEFIAESGQTVQGHNKLFKNNEVIQRFDADHALSGDFVYPFTFGLLSHLPGSYREASDYSALIRYCIRGIPSLEQQIDLILRQSIEQNLPRSLYVSSKIQCTSCFCLDKGSSKVDFFFQKCSYNSADDCYLNCQIDNSNCSQEIVRIRCQLVKQLVLTADNGVQRIFLQKLQYVEFKGVESGQTRYGDEIQRQKFCLIHPKTFIPLNGITNGQKVKCRYFMEIRPEINGFFMKISGGVLNLKLNVLQDGKKLENLVQPSTWNPSFQNSTTIILNFSEANELLSSMSPSVQKD